MIAKIYDECEGCRELLDRRDLREFDPEDGSGSWLYCRACIRQEEKQLGLGFYDCRISEAPPEPYPSDEELDRLRGSLDGVLLTDLERGDSR